MIKLSVLDQSPISDGSTAAQAFSHTVTLAQEVDKLGYTRFLGIRTSQFCKPCWLKSRNTYFSYCSENGADESRFGWCHVATL